MTDSITVFQFSSNDVRVLILDNEPWFIGADVCKILDIRNTGDAYSRLRECEKRNLDCSQVIGIADNPDIKRLTAISEPGLYRLIMTSRKPEAEPFQDWVCQEVLPQIRKTGSYQQQPKTQLQILADMAQALVAQEEAMLKMQLEQLQAQKLSEIESLTHQHDGEIDRIFNPNGHYFSVMGLFF
jgi:prophage antirepressor-like protein